MDYEETPTQSQAQRYWRIRRYKPIRLLEKILHEEAKLAKERNQDLGGSCLETHQGTPKLKGIERKLKSRAFRPRQLFPEPESTQWQNPTSYEPPTPLRRDPSPSQYQYSPEQYGSSPAQYQASPAQYGASPAEYSAATPYQEDYGEYDQSQEYDQSYGAAEIRTVPPNRASPVSPTCRCFHTAPPAQTYQQEEESPIYDHYVQSPEFDEYEPSPTSQTCPHYPEGDPYTTPVQYHHLNTSDEYPGSEAQAQYIDPLDNFEHFKMTIMAALNKDQEDYASLMHFLNSEEDMERFHDLFLEYKENKLREQGYL